MDYSVWRDRWNSALRACEKLGGETFEFIVLPPASEDAISDIERELGLTLPLSFRTVLREFSAGVDVKWKLPRQCRAPVPLKGIFSGSVHWSLAELPQIEDSKKLWLDVFPDLDDLYDRVWHNKLAFCDAPNGDCIAFDLSLMPDPPIVYLSHDDGEGHGYWLGDNFMDYIERLSKLGCPGNEDWQMMPFLSDPKSGLDPDCENARQWKQWFGMNI